MKKYLLLLLIGVLGVSFFLVPPLLMAQWRKGQPSPFGAPWHYMTLLPSGATLDDANPPSITVVESTGTGTSRFWVTDFDATTDEIIYFSFITPADLGTSSWYFDVYWFSNDVGANETCVWEASVSATSEGDVDAITEQAVGTTNFASEDVNTTEANRLIVTTITLSNLDGVAAGDNVVIKFSRDADSTNATDDLTSDSRLLKIRLRIPRE